MTDKHTSSSAISDELRKEFEHNYRCYLENAYIFNRINEILLDSEISLSGVPDEVRAVDSDTESVRLKKLRQKFLHAINSSNAACVDNVSANVSANRLTSDEKTFLRTKIGQEVDEELGLINQVLNCQTNEENNQRLF